MNDVIPRFNHLTREQVSAMDRVDAFDLDSNDPESVERYTNLRLEYVRASAASAALLEHVANNLSILATAFASELVKLAGQSRGT